MRRLILVDPFSRSAIWSRNFAVFALIVALFGILLSHKGLDPEASLAIEASALALSALAVLCAFVAMGVIWRTGFRGIGLALGGLVLSALLYLYPLYLAMEARTIPSILDVSTDLLHPPAFSTSLVAKAARHGWDIPKTPSAAGSALQTQLYPDLQTLVIDDDTAGVEKTIHRMIRHHHWTIVDEVRAVDAASGHIDVVVKSALMGFPTDLTFRLEPAGDQTKVDIRSVARGGWLERPGSNVARVLDLAAELGTTNAES